MVRKNQIKKGKYQFVGNIKIKSSQIYLKFNPSHMVYVEKFHRLDNGHPMLLKNCPVTLTAIEFVKMGKKIFDDLDATPYVQYNCAYYGVTSRKHKKRIVKRVVSIVKSIRKHGYAKGKYSNNTIGVIRGVNPYFGNVTGYELISGKHRCAACVALGKKKIKVGLWKYVGRQKRF